MALENVFQDIPGTVIVFSEEVLCFRHNEAFLIC